MTEKKGVVLVVDDQPNNLKVLLTFLERQNFQVMVAQNGERALQAVANGQPEILLLDVMMPGMDGFETCRKLKENKETASIPVIFMTALDGVEDKVTGFEVGGVDYITKPFQEVEVLARLNTHITMRRQQLALERMATHDQLTGLYNRHHFINTFEQEMNRCRRYKNDLVLMMLDIDHFKKVNDTCGHKCGDNVLQQLAGRLEDTVRTTDSTFRFGGEEFVILLPETNINSCYHVAEKIRKACAEVPFSLDCNLKTITVSIGIVSYHGQPLQNINDLINFADQALYQAKENGRNQVVIYS